MCTILSPFFLAVCAPLSTTPAWQIAVPIVVGLLVLGFLAILLARLILFLLVSLINAFTIVALIQRMYQVMDDILPVQDRYEYQQFKKEVGQSQFGPVRFMYCCALQLF